MTMSPPGSRAIRLPTLRTQVLDPSPELERLREHEPLHPLAFPDGHEGWLVTGHSLARAVLGDRRFSRRSEWNRLAADPSLERGGRRWLFGRQAPLGFFLHMDPPEHTRYRRLLAGHFTVRRVQQLRPGLERIVEKYLDAMEAAGPPVDLVTSFALPVPLEAICELLGVPDGARPAIHQCAARFLNRRSTPQEASAAWGDLVGVIRELIQTKRTNQEDDLLSRLASSSGFSDDELAGVGAFLFNAGHLTTMNMFALGVFALLCHREQFELLRCDPSLTASAVDEFVRYLSIFIFGVERVAVEDVELGSRIIERGTSVQVSLDAANRDPAAFDQPGALDVTRQARGHLGFSYGVHQCLGQHLARLELQLGYGGLIRRFPNLDLAVPVSEVALTDDDRAIGAHKLPIAW